MEVGEDAVVRALGGAAGDSVDELLDQVESSGQAGRLDEVGRWLGVGLANLVNIFNPEAVVFGGLLSRVLPLVEDSLRAELGAALTAPRAKMSRLSAL